MNNVFPFLIISFYRHVIAILMFQVCYVSKSQSADGRLRYSSGCTLNQVCKCIFDIYVIQVYPNRCVHTLTLRMLVNCP